MIRVLSGLVVVLTLVSPSSAASTMRVVGSVVSPGSPTSAIVELSHTRPIQGYQTVMLYDKTLLTFTGITTIGLDIEDALGVDGVEFFIVVEEEVGPGLGLASQGAIFDMVPPFDHQLLNPGNALSVARYLFNTSPTAPVDTFTTLELANGLGTSQYENIIVVDGFSETPDLLTGTISFVAELPFLRGDANGDGTVDGLVDPIFLLQAQFIPGSPQPPCLDAADANDDGMFNGMTDTIFLLDYAFLQGAPPPPPGALTCGMDPTADELLCEETSCP